MVTRMTRARRETPHDCTCTCPGQHTRAGLAKHVALASHSTSWGNHVSKYIIGKKQAVFSFIPIPVPRKTTEPVHGTRPKQTNLWVFVRVCECFEFPRFFFLASTSRKINKHTAFPYLPSRISFYSFCLPTLLSLGQEKRRSDCPSQEHTNYNAHAEVGNAFDMPRWCKLGPKCA